MIFETTIFMRKKRSYQNKSGTCFGKFLDDNKILQKDIAELLNISTQHVSNLYWGKTPLSKEYMQKLTKHYDLAWDYFYDEKPPVFEVKEESVLYKSKDVSVNKELSEIIAMAIKVLTSGMHYANSLRINIISFYDAVNVMQKCEEMEARISSLEKLIPKINSPDEDLKQKKGSSEGPF